MAKRRGNPNWGKPEPPSMQSSISSFEALVRSLGISPNQYENSAALREWVGRNKDHKYVPPDLLETFGFKAASEV